MQIPSAAGATPSMAQWFAMKADHPNALLFFRMGDFYELFFADAQAAAAALDIALTARGEHGGQPIPMCGVPVHARDAYLARLIRRGFRVALAEQMEDPKKRAGKAPLRREVVRVITPGTLTEDALLEAAQPNLLLALVELAEKPRGRDRSQGAIGAAWLDISTGQFETAQVSRADLASLLGRLAPAEILADAAIPLGPWEDRRGVDWPPAPPRAEDARARLAQAFHVASLDAFGNFTDLEAMAAAMALDYLRLTQAGRQPHLAHPAPQGERGVLAMDAATRVSLDITETRAGDRSQHTLLAAIRRTSTPGGSRLLGTWLHAPLADLGGILARQDGWDFLLSHAALTEELRLGLRAAPDLARALARVALGQAGPRDVAAVGQGLTVAASLASQLPEALPPILQSARQALGALPDLGAYLAGAFVDPVPVRLEDGRAIAPGFDAVLDEERSLRDEQRQILARVQLDYAERYGVPNLKIKHHAQLGYVIEVPAAVSEKLRGFPELVLRQGLASGARFTSTELSELDQKIAAAAERAGARERIVFDGLVKTVMQARDAISACAAALALLDVLQGAARLAEQVGWCRPQMTEGEDFAIEAGRHPVVEAALAGRDPFVPNDCSLSPGQRLMLLTGPNMAGKSTFLRQNALIVILAQAGLPVPAATATIGLVDRLFSRVGASDDLARGRSTFMVEMTETAAILHQGGPRSLVVVDEIGRGTATLDGLAIAWAVLEALHNTVRCRAIFATHFHELARLSGIMPQLQPATMRVKDWKGSVIFLHEVTKGAAGRSWGVHVAALAGVPAPVVKRAGALLASLEKAGPLTQSAELPLFAAAQQQHDAAPGAELGQEPEADRLRQALADIDPEQMTARQALDYLFRLKDLASGASAADSLAS
ncbi:DNA mismatch repair protein MutS [Acidisoma silvae]|uniref:DNA mismatch repair protein MutS n=1 Tax=Acidisoma silvae TaxID=2802396 RepID=A0A963YNZ3_9PROT|nr:DNA mismatch repair protein MutS [Acidisoma silvae]MCB8873984.1 DNA mismatch repair protein MutS [Acidisoma silvae]